MKQIQLTRGQVALVDDEDYAALYKFKWFAWWEKKTRSFYALRTAGVGESPSSIRMHRQLLDAPEGIQVDHYNHNTLDNRRENLRLATSQQNTRNSKQRSDNASGYKGVDWHKQPSKWRASITVDGKQRTIGHFTTKELARDAYVAAAKSLHGDFYYNTAA